MNSNLVTKWLIVAIASAATYFIYMTPPRYTTDLGLRLTIAADDYVASGKWVFTCGTTRLISRIPIPFTPDDFKPENIEIRITFLDEKNEAAAIRAINALLADSSWPERLRYQFSALNENSELGSHIFGSIENHDAQQWEVNVIRRVRRKPLKRYTITAQPYIPVEYTTHELALSKALSSCPIRQ